jgi:heterotetrameric sarcosine oxidase alpha subunit
MAGEEQLMGKQPFRLKKGGQVDRSRPVHFKFDGRNYEGFAGDTLASALLANGVLLTGRSFKYHRPRGIFATGPEEPNALVRLGSGPYGEPNTRATMIELKDGLETESQNRWPSLGFDVSALTGFFSAFIPAGFYYKTFMSPRWAWPFFEHVIRSAAGLGRAPSDPDPDTYEHRFEHCDVVVVGAGPTGIAAALTAGRAGERVILVDQDFQLGGSLLSSRNREIEGKNVRTWLADSIAELTAMEDVRILPRTTAFGKFDGNQLGLIEIAADDRPSKAPRQRLWKVRAGRIVVAAGAIERPMVFDNNDRPGVMLAGALRTYLNRFAVVPGQRIVIFTNNDSAYALAKSLLDCGKPPVVVVDARSDPGPVARGAEDSGVKILAGYGVTGTRGSHRIKAIEISPLDAEGGYAVGPYQVIDCDLLAVSGGWSPTIHLYCQAGGRAVFQNDLAAFTAGADLPGLALVGAANGTFDLDDALTEGKQAGNNKQQPSKKTGRRGYDISPLWVVSKKDRQPGKGFVDLQSDVTVNDVLLAAREGYQSVEHVKRYTALGMGTDQGKTSNVNGLAVLARHLGKAIPEVGTTTFRPPYTPVTMGAIAGPEIGIDLSPVRRTPIQEWHEKAGAVFVPAGLWRRAHHYPQPGETVAQAVKREAANVRKAVGIVDVSTLGRIDIHGPDTAEFLNRVYINGWKTLAVGKTRYGVMLREDGMVFDDGTTARVAEHHYIMTTTTANAGPVMTHLEYMLQIEWPELDVNVASVTDQWAVVAVAGPNSRQVLENLIDDGDVSDEGLPFMGCMETRIGGQAARIFRISFSGELAYEIAVAADFGLNLWQSLLQVGEAFGVQPYGTEALTVLRTEKGHFVMGPEADGRATAADLGLGKMMSTKKSFIGSQLVNRPAVCAAGRKVLVGLVSSTGTVSIPPGAQIVSDPADPVSIGHVTTNVFSPEMDLEIALAMIENGVERIGEELIAFSPVAGKSVRVRVCSSIFVDPKGERLHG